MRVTARRELIAPAEDVWGFLAEPYHLSDWWPGIAGVEPDRRRLARGARWQVRTSSRPSLLRRANAIGMLLVRDVEPLRRVAWHLTGERLDVELQLEPAGRDRTVATLTVSGAWLVGRRRSLPERALARLHALCQTAADL